ncbi:MAG: DUF1598 domain-containing protein [Pirellulales bacterium]|nr:DUF1598 domain-containing protein [Pirellulales bacterium]
MIHRANAVHKLPCQTFLVVLAFAFVFSVSAPALGQDDSDEGRYDRAVGGISIDADGLLSGAQPDALDALSKLRRQAMQQIPDGMSETSETRKISLRQLEAALAECLANDKPIPDEIKYLAGLQRIEYVFVYPELKDVVLVGVGEGWKVDDRGNVVGVKSGRPTMLLDDLLVAIRTARDARRGGITCSIDPTPEGLQNMQQVPGPTRNSDRTEAWAYAATLAKALGPQRISINGVPADSHFARVLVAADYRMKRIAMNIEPSPLRGLPSYLQMHPSRARGFKTPRFWLEPSYEAILHDEDALSFELSGSAVVAKTEEDYLATTGNVKHSGKAGGPAQRWANLMTQKYAELAVADPIFGELHNCMDLAVIGALVVREGLLEKAGLDLPAIMDEDRLATQDFNAPKQVESLPSVLRVGGKWIAAASGGVAINSWGLVEKSLRDGENAATIREKAAPAEKSWWWN